MGHDASQDTSQSTQSMADRENTKSVLHFKLIYFDLLECNGVGYLNSEHVRGVSGLELTHHSQNRTVIGAKS